MSLFSFIFGDVSGPPRTKIVMLERIRAEEAKWADIYRQSKEAELKEETRKNEALVKAIVDALERRGVSNDI